MHQPYQQDPTQPPNSQLSTLTTSQSYHHRKSHLTQLLPSLPLSQPIIIKFLTCCEQWYIERAVSIPKLDTYIRKHLHLLCSSQEDLRSLFNVYRRRLMVEVIEWGDEELVRGHCGVFYEVMKGKKGEDQLLGEYIRWQLVAGAIQEGMNWGFAGFVHKFRNLDPHVHFLCLMEYIRNPDYYDFKEILHSTVFNLRDQLTNFMQKYEGKQYGNTEYTIKQLILLIIQVYKTQGYLSQFRQYLFKNLVPNLTFNYQLLSFCKKFNHIAIFHSWLQMLIQMGHLSLAIQLSQTIILNYTTLIPQCCLSQLIDQYPEFSQQWITKTLNRKPLEVITLFLNDHMQSFLIFNKLLHYYQFRSEREFGERLDLYGYHLVVRKFVGDPEVRDVVVRVFRGVMGECEEILGEMFGGLE